MKSQSGFRIYIRPDTSNIVRAPLFMQCDEFVIVIMCARRVGGGGGARERVWAHALGSVLPLPLIHFTATDMAFIQSFEFTFTTKPMRIISIPPTPHPCTLLLNGADMRRNLHT